MEKQPRPPEAGLCTKEPALASGGLKIRVPAPAVYCLCPNSHTLGISTWMSHRTLELMSQFSTYLYTPPVPNLLQLPPI